MDGGGGIAADFCISDCKIAYFSVNLDGYAVLPYNCGGGSFMKRFISLLLIAITATLSAALCACFVNISGDGDLAKQYMGQLTDSLQEGDSGSVRSLFAANKIADIEDFDEDIAELISYFVGDYVSDTLDTPATVSDTNGGVTKKWFNMGCDVNTTSGKYRFSICWCVADSGDSGNIGIWSLYIFNYEDNLLEDYSFYPSGSWTDFQWESGINIVKPYKYLSMMLNILSGDYVAAAEGLFAQNLRDGQADFGDSLNQLLEFFVFEAGGFESVACEEITEEGAGGRKVFVVQSCKVTAIPSNLIPYSASQSDVTVYEIAYKYCVRDTEDSGNTGIWSLYIRYGADTASDDIYFGDGLWTDGINIG